MAIPFSQPDLQVAADGSRVWEARLFGAFHLTAPDGSNATPVGRKTRALIAFLFATIGDGATRDRLCGLFYSERSEEQARASLRQLLHEMRGLTSTGEPLVVLDRFRAHIAPPLAATDLARMQALAAADDAAGLATLIGHQPPDLLTDLDGIDPGFDDWLAFERIRCADERRRIVLEAAERANAQGQPAAALRLAACLLARDPTDEVAARLAMIASHRHGDQDRGRALFARLKGALRADLGVDPSEETQGIYRRLSTTPTVEHVEPVDERSDDAAREPVEAAPHHGDHSAPPPRPADAVPAVPAVPAMAAMAVHVSMLPQEPSVNAWRGGRRRTMIIAAIIGLVIVALVCAGLAWRWHSGRVEQHVLRVDALRTPPGDTAAQALDVGFASTLARLIFANDTTLDVIAAGQAAGASDRRGTFAIDGDARGDGSRLHVDVRLRRESDGATLWSATFSRPIFEIDALREQMAYRIAGVATCATGRKNPTVDAFSVESLRRLFAACAQMHSDENEVVEDLTKVLEQQPDFAHGWAMLALATAWTAGPGPGAEEAGHAAAVRMADRALALDPHDGTAYVAKSATFAPLKSWPQRMGVLERGRAVDPANATVLASIAGSLAEIGRLDEALPIAQRVVELDPFDPDKTLLRADLIVASGDGPDGKVALQVARRRFPTDTKIAIADFRYNAFDGDTNRALALISNAADRGFNLQPVRAALWKAVITARAAPSTAHDDEAYRAFLASHRVLGAGFDLPDLVMLAVLHRNDEAFAAAAEIDLDRYEEQTALLFTALAKPLRADPRFMTLAKRLGLLEVWQQTGRWPDFCGDRSVPYDCRVEAQRAMSSEPRPSVGGR